jgi:hypothetical protein
MKTLLLIATLALSLAGTASAQQPCAPLTEITPQFLQKYGEVPAYVADMAVQGQPVGFMLFKSPKGTWTAFSVDADGLACFLAAGGNWKDFNPRGDL